MEDITAEELNSKIENEEDFVLIDVREPFEYSAYNIGGYLIPMNALADAVAQWDEIREKEIVIICRSGARSAAAKNFLEVNGFTKVRNLIGGLLSWKQFHS